MPNMINTSSDSGVGSPNFFYNYRTPLVAGQSRPLVTGNETELRDFLTQAYGAINGNWAVESVGYNRYDVGEGYAIRFPAPGLEPKINTRRLCFSPWMGHFWYDRGVGGAGIKWMDFSNSDAGVYSGPLAGSATGELNLSSYTSVPMFWVANKYSICMAVFQDAALTNLLGFRYYGWTREPAYTDKVSLRGFIYISEQASKNTAYQNGINAFMPLSENSTLLKYIRNSNDTVTNPPITCVSTVPGADTTDVLIREHTSPNFAVGKLYNCISLPNTAPIGSLWRNTGLDPDTGLPHASSNTNKYLVIMAWGWRKLGMRIWTENFA